MIVVDASALVDVMTGSGDAARLRRVIAQEAALQAPHMIDLEVLHALRGMARGGKLTNAAAGIALEDFAQLRITRHAHGELLHHVWELRDQFTAYDAAYVALAHLLDAPLLTTDARLARSARGLVDVVGVSPER